MVRAGPSAKPALPPSANRLIPFALASPDAKLAWRAASGWKAATPIPESTIAAKVSG